MIAKTEREFELLRRMAIIWGDCADELQWIKEDARVKSGVAKSHRNRRVQGLLEEARKIGLTNKAGIARYLGVSRKTIDEIVKGTWKGAGNE